MFLVNAQQEKQNKQWHLLWCSALQSVKHC